MRTQASEERNQRGRTKGVAMITSCAAVIAPLLVWAASSLGSSSADQTLTPARSSAVPARAAAARDSSAHPKHGSGDRPARTICAGLGKIAASQETGQSDGLGGTVGCGVYRTLVRGAPATKQREGPAPAAAFPAWHTQVRNLILFDYRITSQRLSQMNTDQSYG